MVKNTPANVGDIRIEFDPWVGKIAGGGHRNPHQYPWLENPMSRGGLQVVVHRVEKSQTQLKRLSTHAMLNK